MDFEIKYKKGCETPADYLSRNVIEAIVISNKDLAKMPDRDKFCASLKQLVNKKTVEIEFEKRVLQ
jgi:hypothetical protein